MGGTNGTAMVNGARRAAQGAAVIVEVARLPRGTDRRAVAVRSAALRSLLPVLTASERRADRRVAALRRSLEADTSEVVIDSGETYTVSQLTRQGSKPPRWTRFLYRLEEVHAARHVIELGTNAGVSAAALALALPPDGHLWTLDVNLTDRSVTALEGAGLGDRVTVVPGYFDDTLEEVLAATGRVGLAFVDGHHQEAATMAYFERLLPHLTSDAIVVFDDIHWSAGMTSAWRQLRAHDATAWSADLRSVGVMAVRAG
jgi:predicted O-methyltransferase YrrM